MAGKPKPREHGTMTGYKQHEWRKEKKCRECLDARAAHVRIQRANSESYKKYSKEYTERNKEKLNAQSRARYEKNNEKLREQARIRWQKNGDHLIALRKKRYQKDPDKILQYGRKRRALKYNSDFVKYTTEDILSLYGTDCHVCKEPIDLEAPRLARPGTNWQLSLHLDHVIPLSKGGNDNPENIRPCHAVCNLSKGDKVLSSAQSQAVNKR